MDINAISQTVRQEILDGRYERGSRILGVREKAKELRVSHQTVANAYGRLAALGMIETRPNGTFVIAGPTADAHLGTYGPPDITRGKAWKAASSEDESERTYDVRQTSAPHSMTEWGITPGIQIVQRHRLRAVNGATTQYKVTVMPYDVASKVPDGYDGIAPMMAPVGAQPVWPPEGMRWSEWLGWDVDHIATSITVDPMDEDSAKMLELPEGTPGFHVAAVAKSSTGATTFVTLTVAPLHHRLTLHSQ